MRKQYRKARFRKVWFRRMRMDMEWTIVPIDFVIRKKRYSYVRRLSHRKRHDLRPWE